MTEAPRANDFYAALEYQITDARAQLVRLEEFAREVTIAPSEYQRRVAYEQGRIEAATAIRDTAERLAKNWG